MSGRLSRLLRGLFVPASIRSREEQRWCAADPFPSGSYNFQFLRSRAEGDFVRHPDLLWSPTPYWTARAGLNAHVRELADRLGGSVYSDALIVLHPRDFARTQDSMLQSWAAAARQELADCFDRLLDSQGFSRAVPGRSFHLEVVPDAGPRMGTTLGLQPGEFATAMLPNLHLGPDEGSVPLVEVFVSTGGGRFESGGTLWSDQLAFTVGAHALDNCTVAGLGDSALYTVHRFPDQPGLRHKLGGDHVDRLAIKTGQAHGGETVQVVDMGREKVLLEVMLVAARPPLAEMPRPGERAGRLPGGRPADLPFAPLPGGVQGGTILPEDADIGSFGAFSIIPESLPDRIHTLSERAYLLQRVHFSQVMSGYTMDLDRSGQVVPCAQDAVARFEVRGERTGLVACSRDLSLDGRPLRPGEDVPLCGTEHRVSWRGGDLEFRSLRRKDRRWPYLARLATPRRAHPLTGGESWTLGRDHACDVLLPDRMTTSNILWRDAGGGETIETRGGAVPRTSVRTDAILVASKAARIDLSGDAPVLHNPSTSCPVHVLRAGGETVRIGHGGRADLLPGDEVLVGNHAFALAGPGDGEPARNAARTPSPPVDLISLPERLDAGPGGRGRRPRAGGASGRLVDASRTVGALLGISPEGEPRMDAARVQVAVPPPLPAPLGPPPAPPARPADPRDDRLPTCCAPSLSLDVTADGVDGGTADGRPHGDLPPDLALTMVEEEPDWQALAAGAAEAATRGQDYPSDPATSDSGARQDEAMVEVARVEVETQAHAFLERVVGRMPSPQEAVRDLADLEELAGHDPVAGGQPAAVPAFMPAPCPAAAAPARVLPRGLRIPTVPTMGPEIQAVRRRGGSLGLPSFGLPTRRRPAAAPSVSGD